MRRLDPARTRNGDSYLLTSVAVIDPLGGMALYSGVPIEMEAVR
jgi:hypothetical protein